MEHRRGAQAYGPLSSSDQRVSQLSQRSLERDPRQTPGTAVDPFLFAAQRVARPFEARLSFGQVDQVIPYFGWHRVKLDDQGGTLGCYLAGEFNASPLGARRVGVVMPGQRVIVQHIPGLTIGSILAVAPASIVDPWAYRPPWVLPGGGGGFLREQAHHQILKLKKGGGVRDFSAGMPLDANILDEGFSYFTGAGLVLNPFLLQLRMGPLCGLWLNWFDRSARLAGRVLELMSPAEVLQSLNDEGELAMERVCPVYAWEAAGLLSPTAVPGRRYDEKDVQYKGPEASKDLPKADRGLKAYGRYREFGGYLGQGRQRLLTAPQTGAEKNDESHKPVGLFSESIGLEGMYVAQAAHSWYAIKRVVVSSPARRKAAADPTGDRSRGEGAAYKSASQFGDGPDHKVHAGLEATDRLSRQQAAAVDDLLAHLCAWKIVHTYHYHDKDFEMGEESESTFGRSQENVPYGSLSSQHDLPAAVPVKFRIDHRYGDVDFYRRTSFLALHPDGSVGIGGGCGADIVIKDGRIALRAPAGVDIIGGGRSVFHVGELVVKSHRSIDISSAQGDLRLASPKGNMQFVGDSLLLESLSETNSYQFQDKIGEDARSSGIVMKSATAIVGWADSFYLKSGAGSTQNGDIVFDANERRNSILVHARQIQGYLEGDFLIAQGDRNSEDFETFHRLGRTTSWIGSTTNIEGKLAVSGDEAGLLVGGHITAIGSVSCTGKMADKTGGVLAKIPDDYETKVQQQEDKIVEIFNSAVDVLGQVYQRLFPNGYYDDERAGNSDLIDNAGFSYRDDDDSRQYQSTSLVLEEARWQRWARLGLASGGASWRETPVEYQGRQLYPWPGRKAWTEEDAYLQTDASDTFLPDEGRAADRGTAHETAKYGTARRVKLADEFTILLG